MPDGQIKASMTFLREETERAFTSSGMGVGKKEGLKQAREEH